MVWVTSVLRFVVITCLPESREKHLTNMNISCESAAHRSINLTLMHRRFTVRFDLSHALAKLFLEELSQYFLSQYSSAAGMKHREMKASFR